MNMETKHLYAFGPFRLDPEERVLLRDGSPVPLGPKVIETLLLLVQNAGHLVDKDDLMKRVWPDAYVEEGNLNKHVFLLRKALGRWDGGLEYIETVTRRGYRFVATVNRVAEEDRSSQPQTEAGSHLIGKKISHYRVLQLLGGGGMGLIYQAEDLKLGRRVALKFLPQELARDSVALLRLEREARAASALNHPNICTTYAIEEHENQSFIAMELLEGETLRELISSASSQPESDLRALPTDKLLDLAIQVTEGLDAAHRKGIIHRDIKPANIFVTVQGQAKILDFGLAKLQGSDAKEGQLSPAEERQRKQEWNPNLSLTRTGTTLGTAGYMSPEQLRADKLDARTDLFSFGMVLYEMATGQRAFAGDTATVLREAILNCTPTPVRELNNKIPPRLERIINRALEKDRDTRYQHAADLLADLQQLQRQRESPSSVAPSAAPETARNSFKFWAAAAVVAVAALAAAGFWYLRPAKAGQIDSVAVLPFTNVNGDASTNYLSDGITESLIASLTHVPDLKVKSRTSIFRYKGKDVDAQKIGSELGVSALVSGRVTPHGDTMEVNVELTDVRDNNELWSQHYSGKSTDIISLESQIAGDLAAKLRSRISASEEQQVSRQGTQNLEAYELYLQGRYVWNRRSKTDLEQAISYFNQAIAKDPGYALAYAGLADAYAMVPYYVDVNPRESITKSNTAARKALELDPGLADPHAVLGNNEMLYDRDFSGGETEYKKAFELDPNDATPHQWYAERLAEMGGREQEALAEVNRAHQLDPLSPIISYEVGNVYTRARRYDEAIALCKNLADENPAFPKAHECLATAYVGKRMYPQALEEWKSMVLVSGDASGYKVAQTFEQAFRSGGWRGVLTKSIQAAEAARRTGFVPAFGIAALYTQLGDKDQAFRWLNIAYQEGDIGLSGLKNDFRLDPLHSDPRFADLVRKVGLPQ
jgi:serine/threonine protein kinase